MPENRGNSTAYAGATTHRPLPLASAQPTSRAAHQEQPRRPTSTFDWDWNKDLCTRCTAKVPKSHLVDGVCRTCRGDTPTKEIPADVTPAAPRTTTSKGGQTFRPFDEVDLDARYHAPSTTPPTLEPAPQPAPEPELEPEPVEPVEDDQTPAGGNAPVTALTGATYADLLDQQLDHTTRTLTKAHGVHDPIVGILRSAVLSSIAALDIYLELHQGEGERRPATSPPTTNPRRGRGGRPKIITTPETTTDVIRRYRDQQHSLVQIANDTGHGKSLIRRILTDAGIPIRPPIGRPTTLSPEQEQAVVQDYLAGQASPAVGKTYGIRADTVRDLVRAAGHPIRPRTAPGGSINTRLTELDVTSRQVKEWAVAEGLLPAVVRGSVAHSVIDAYQAAHQPAQEGQPA